MSGDYSRIAFDPWLDDLGVLLQQGRPLTDRDWNDQALQLNRRIHAGTLDTIGGAVVPMQTPEGFEIEATGGALTIGRGRIYVDGILAENHGQAPDGGTLDWDPHLAELFGSNPINYTDQLNYPNAPALPTGGPHLVYLDVWQREVNRYIRPSLMDAALAVDTTTRLQTIWQVKVLPDIGTNVNCQTPLDQIPGWLPDHAPSAGRLTVTTAPVPGQPDPCQVPPSGGYKGLENQLYRVEIHQGGAAGTATFTWSRDNASVEASVVEIPSLTQIVVDSIAKDSVLRFSPGDWIDIADEWIELHHQPAIVRRIASGGVDDATRTITLEQPLPPGQFPVDGQTLPDPARRTRIRRWDQKHQVFDANGTEIQNLDDPASDGTITIPAAATEILLEHNIVVSFSLQTSGEFHTGEHWVFAARNADASVEELTEAPPRGIHHHYATLAIVTFPDDEIDCRQFWPPTFTAPEPTEAEPCACTVCVTPQTHSSGTLTIQMAIDQVLQHEGGIVCLDVGTYAIQETLQILEMQSLKIVGQGSLTRLEGQTRIIRIEQSQDVTLEAFAIVCRPAATAPDAAVVVTSSSDIAINDLLIRIENDNPAWAALALSGALVRVSLRYTFFSASVGIRSADQTGGQTGLTDLRIENNSFECQSSAINMTGVTVHQFVSHIRGNRIIGCGESGIILTGATVPGFGVNVEGNAIAVQGAGIVASLDGLRVHDNEILQAQGATGNHSGIRLMPGVAANDSLDNIQILGNRIAGFRAEAIGMRAPRARALAIKHNRVVQCGNGFVFDGALELEAVAIEDNQLSGIDGFALRGEGASAILIAANNQIATLGPESAVSLVFQRGDTTFDQNQVLRPAVQGPGTPSADVLLSAGTLIVGSNRVQASPLSIHLHVAEQHFTVLGNICRGRIQVNNAPLQPPWVPLNLQGVS